MKGFYTITKLMTSVAFVSVMGVCHSQALAQGMPAAGSTEQNTSEIGDIIVTAERREQSAQKAPLTIQVLGGEQAEKAGLSSAMDLNKLTTGVAIGSGGANTQIFIRGVGGFSFTVLSNPGVAFNVDGVYVGRPNGVNGNFYDLARVEVLKGPQGTLYGRNANGGSINVITNEPKLGETTLNLGLEAGNYDLVHASGAVNLPLGSTAAIRAAFNVVDRDGYLSNGANDDVQQSARLRLKWEPSSAVSLLLNADYSHIGGKGGDYVYRPQRPGSSPWEAQSEPAANAYMHAFGPAGAVADNIYDDARQKLEFYNLSAQLDVDIGDLAKLTVIPAYRHMTAFYTTHFSQRLTGDELSKQKSLEVRLGNSSNKLTWVLGGYAYSDSSPDSRANVYASNILQNYLLVYSPKTTAYAAFGQATYSLADRLRLIVGGRYTHEKQSLSGYINNLATTPVSLIENFGGKVRFGDFTYKVGGEFDFSPRSMVFVTYSTGFKAGGLNQTVAPLATYQPEKLKSLEFGSRNRFFNNRLQLNFGAFHWKYSNIQDQRVSFDPLNQVNFLTFNSGSATLYGGNVDIVARPTENDTISFAAEYTHSKYDKFFFQLPAPIYAMNPTSVGCPNVGTFAPGATLPYTQQNGSNINSGIAPAVVFDCSGYQVARAPKWTGSVSYAHEFFLANNGSITIDGTLKFESARWINVDFIASERDNAYAVFDANLTYTSPDKNWTVGVFGRNLTKSVYYTGGIQATFIGGLFAGNIAPPRTYGLRASFKFGS